MFNINCRIATSTSAYARSVNSALRSRQGGAPSNGMPNVAKFLGSSYQTHLYSLPTSGEVARLPWSGDYNAWRYGGISARFGKMDTRWKSYLRSIGSYSQPGDYNANKDNADFEDRIANIYSTAEKYDILVGDLTFSMTNAHKTYGYRLGGRRGDISSWMGMCDGWSSASWMIPEPLHAVTLLAADSKTRVKFWVDDIKNLATAFWRGAKYDNRMVGSRNGGINPASFFLIFANQIGLRRKNMNVEPFLDNEIWNFPAKGYKVTYGGSSGISSARTGRNLILRQGAANSPASSSNVVPVQMTISYVEETNSSINPKPRKTGSSRYSFLLYLNGENRIVGGVWTSARKSSYVWGPGENVSGAGAGLGASPSSLAGATGLAQQTSRSTLMPLQGVLNALSRMSR